MIVYGSPISPFVRKVLMFAAEKGVEVELKMGGMGQGGDEFLEASPFGKMPALRDPGAGFHGDYTLADSSAICHYIEGKHPENPLFTSDPRSRAECVWLDEFADTILMASGGKVFFNRVVAPLFIKMPADEAAIAAGVAELPRILAWLDGRLDGREFLVGEALSYADIAVIPAFGNLAWCGYDISDYPNVARWVGAIGGRPSIAGWNAKCAGIVARAQAAAG